MYPDAYIDYLAHFHGTRDYFECHEVLEDYWKATDPKNRQSVWVLLIQIAVSLYHYRRGNIKGAEILINRSIKKLEHNQRQLRGLGLDEKILEKQLKKIQEQILSSEPYVSIQLPINDRELLNKTIQRCYQWNVTFYSTSDLSNPELVDKHKRRK
ncbi:DUF309 domain-containing protein [Halobacillus salinarum]|uniref:DUF309 domain-containing protein n=1 Tax=Halobacillus salinarum TaxID=2932257 RepID=A0ABY4EDX8_9BACI|nr:DUF309 domain-containing protein [Halobacillus salinarum]UOQ42660.1 DUF309 domain-containing protein [Halobacillus salinarum]